MLRGCMILVATFLVATLDVRAEGSAQAPSTDETCSVAADGRWSQQERFVWERICEGKVADLAEAPGGPPDIDVLRSSFLESILLDDKYSRALTPRGVRIFGARFPDLIDLQNAELQRELWLERCRLEKGVDFSWLKSAQPIGFRGSTIVGKLEMYRVQINSDLFMDNMPQVGEVDLLGASVGQTFNLSGSSVTGVLDMTGLHVGGDLLVDRAEFDEVKLMGAQVGQTLNVSGSKVIGTLEMNGLQVARDLLMQGKANFAEIKLVGAHIGGRVDMTGSTFHQNVDLTGAQIGSDLSLGLETKWSNDSTLILQNAKADLFPKLSDAWPDHVDLEGLTYRSAGAVSDNDVNWFDKLPRYSPQPYEQLAAVLQNQGDIEHATMIRYGARQKENSNSTDRWRRIWLTVLDWVIGYGYYPHRAIYFAFGLVFLGFLILRISGEGAKHQIGLSYSFDMLIPVIRLREMHYQIDLGSWTRLYFYVHKILGWVLLIFLGAVFSGLTK